MATSGAAATYHQQQHKQYRDHLDVGVEDASNTNELTGSVAAPATSTLAAEPLPQQCQREDDADDAASAPHTTQVATMPAAPTTAANKNVLLCRRFKDSGGVLRNFNSLPLFVYATSPSTRATSADGVGVLKEVAAIEKNDTYDLALCTKNIIVGGGAMDCLPMSGSAHHHAAMSASTAGMPGPSTTTVVVGGAGGVAYQHHLNLGHHLHHLSNHHSPYSNNYPLHHSSSHHHLHSDQTKSLQELQHEVGALLEFRDLVIETFPDLKHKMASMSSSATSAAVCGSVNAPVSGTHTLTTGGGITSTSLASRREWEPGIRVKRKMSQKEYSNASSTSAATVVSGGNSGTVAAGELSSSSLSRSRSNSHSGKKEPKSGENNNGSVVQDSGFSTETSSSKEGHSASSTNGASTGPIALNRLPCLDPDDELLNLLDVIHRKSNRLREEVEHLQTYERHNLRNAIAGELSTTGSETVTVSTLAKSSNSGSSNELTPKTFREHVERLNKEDIKQLRKERDRLLDKLAEMEAETLTGRIKAAKISDQVQELMTVKKDLEEQLKLAMAQKLELSSRVQQMQQQQQAQQLQSKSSSSQSDYSSQRNFLSSATTVLSTGSGISHVDSTTTVPSQNRAVHPNTFQPVVVIDQQHHQQQQEDARFAFHQSAGSDNKNQQTPLQLGRLDGIVSTPGGRNTKCRNTDSERIAAILLETSVIELQRHLLTLTVQNQVLMQKLDQTTKSKIHLTKRLDKSKDDVEDLRFQLEEKNIELEGTKAQLRVLESRMNASTPSSSTATNSYMHSQNDYETNRSSASTTLMLSRRGMAAADSHCSDMMCGSSPVSGQMPQPTVMQISTPSMKAMVHLPMDEVQHHSSSTESAHDHELQQELPQTEIARLMSSSVGGVSPFEQTQQRAGAVSRAQQHSTKKAFGTATSKPSKIPLPGSKTASYFSVSGKPPSGRPSTAGRSPPSANTSSGSSASNKSMLSRSTGNLLYSKSPNSLKRADSSQSMRKDNSSLSTNNSRTSSTSSSIPMATTPYSGYKSHGGQVVTTPSPRLLQNSPLPKLKRASLTSRVRHLDSLSRAQQQNDQSNLSHDSDGGAAVGGGGMSHSTTPATSVRSTTSPTAVTPTGSKSYLTTSTPKPSTIAAQLNATLRRDLQMSTNTSSNGSAQFLRRATGGVSPAEASSSSSTGNASAAAATAATARRFSSASVMGSRVAAAATGGLSPRNHEQGPSGAGANEQHNGSVGSSSVASDSDSGKRSAISCFNTQINPIPKPYSSTRSNHFTCHAKTPSNGPTSAAAAHQVHPPYPHDKLVPHSNIHNVNSFVPDGRTHRPAQVATSQERQYRYGDLQSHFDERWGHYLTDEELEEQLNSECSEFLSSSDQGSDNLLVTFDYGYSDSIEEDMNAAGTRGVYVIHEEDDEDFSADDAVDMHNAHIDHPIWFCTPSPPPDASACDEQMTNPFQVHRMHHNLKDSLISLLNSYTECDADESIVECTNAKVNQVNFFKANYAQR